MATASDIAFAGTPAFAVPTLDALVAAGHRVGVVLTQPDRPAGRGQKMLPSPVKQAALRHGLAVEQPLKFDDVSLPGRLGPRPEVFVVVAYGLLLPDWMLAWPTVACINVHASLLPRWRGAAPIQRAILAGDAQSGVSIMAMDAGLDTGPVYTSAEAPIRPGETGGSLHDRLAALGAATLTDALGAIVDGRLAPQPQRGDAVTYAAKLSKGEAALDFSAPAAALERKVRAFDPWPVAFAELDDGRRLRIWAAEAPAPGSATGLGGQPPGSILSATSAGIDIATGDGVLRLLEIQAPSSRRMGVGAWLAAHSVEGAAFV